MLLLLLHEPDAGNCLLKLTDGRQFSAPAIKEPVDGLILPRVLDCYSCLAGDSLQKVTVSVIKHSFVLEVL